MIRNCLNQPAQVNPCNPPENPRITCTTNPSGWVPGLDVHKKINDSRVKNADNPAHRAIVRFLFYASDGDEPIHVHALRDDNMAKFWIAAGSFGQRISAEGVAANQKLVEENNTEIERKWNEFFSRS